MGLSDIPESTDAFKFVRYSIPHEQVALWIDSGHRLKKEQVNLIRKKWGSINIVFQIEF
jgi:hypothetical protein